MQSSDATPRAPAEYAGIFRTDDAARAVYAEAAGIARITPLAVAVPSSAADVVALVRWARATGVPLIPRGSGSSMAGGAIGPGVIIDLGRLDAVGTPDATSRTLVAGPGASRAAIEAAAHEAALRFPPDPSSGRYCTIGGMCATNAAGAHTLRYGATRPWIAGLECVFDDGSRAWIRRGVRPPTSIPAIARFLAIADELAESAAVLPALDVRKESSGYALRAWAASRDLVDLLVGSEGTLALFTGVETILAPRAGATASALASFSTLEASVAAAVEARELGAAACELLDRTFLDVAARGGVPLPVPAGTEAVLLIELEGATADGAREALAGLETRLRALGATSLTLATTAEDEHALWEFRHAASPILARLDPALASMQFIEDGAVPPARLPAYVRGVRAILDRHGVMGVIFGHAGDSHVHVNPLVDVRRPGWRAAVDAILADVVELTVELGGTMAGEHGDGRLRTPFLRRTHGEAASALAARVKEAFDPGGLFNPGVKVPLPGQRALDAIKYDPALPPPPTAAARVLAHVAAERAYLADRLTLLDRFAAAEAGIAP